MGELHDLSIARREKQKRRKRARLDKIAVDLYWIVVAALLALIVMALIAKEGRTWQTALLIIAVAVGLQESILRLLRRSIDHRSGSSDPRKASPRPPPPSAA